MLEMTAKEMAAMYNDFQPEIKHWLDFYQQQHTKFELMNYQQLREMLNAIRSDLVIPPWHPITRYVKEYAIAATIGKAGMNPDTSWFYHTPDKTGCVPDTPIGVQNWIVVHIHAERDGMQANEDLAVEKIDENTDLASVKIWNMRTERLVSRARDQFVVQIFKGTSDATGAYVSFRLSSLIGPVAKATADGENEITFNVGVQRKTRKTKAATEAAKQEVVEQPELPLFNGDKLTQVDLEVVSSALDMAIAHCRSLGMYATVSRWTISSKRVLSTLQALYESQCDLS